MAPHISTWICYTSVAIIFLVNSSNVIKDTNSVPLCTLGIRRFSSKISRRHFYECGNDRGAAATLLECPQETVYNTKKQKCMTRAQESKEEMPIDDKSLGRVIHLGSLFNAKSNVFDNYNSLWTQNTINLNAKKHDKREVHTEFTADKKVKEKISHMDIRGELAGDYMSGMVQVYGAATYLSDDVDRDNEVNVEMMFHTTKYERTLSQYTPKDYPDVCGADAEKNGYTHVVTSVTYGIDAVFVFKYILKSHESESHIGGELDLAIHSIPSFGISGKGKVNLSESQQNIMEQTSISLHGDFSMDDHPAPTTFDTTVDFYKMLPTFAGKDPDWKGAKILKVHMTPLMWVCDDADIVLNSIHEDLMDSLMDMLDQLDQLRIKVGGLVHSDPGEKYPQTIRKNLNTYGTALEQFKSNMTDELQQLLPNIRGGDRHAEDDLHNLITNYTKSQFEYERSSEFLGYRNREIEAIKIVLANYPIAPNTLVCDYEDGNCVDIILHHEYVVTMELNVISPLSFTNDFIHGVLHNESNLWFNNVTQIGELGCLLRNLANFAGENVSPEDTPEDRKKMYIVTLQQLNNSTTPWSIVAMKNGDPLSNNEFEVPVSPPPPSYYDVTYEGFKFLIEKPSEFVLGCKIYTVDILANETITEHDDVDFPEDLNPGDLFEVTVSGLEPATPYTYMVRYKTEVGVAPYSEQSDHVITAPASPPQDLTVDDVTTTSVTVSWSKPNTVGIPEYDLEYFVNMSGEDGYLSQLETDHITLKAVFNGLTDATSYSFSVKAITWVESENGNDTLVEISQSSDETVTTYSSPLTPTMLPPVPGEIGLHQVTARWEPPRKLGTGVTLQKYVLKMKAQGEDDETIFDDIIETKMQIKSLVEGQIYEFRCKIVTTEGESEFSIPVLIQTLSNETAMDKFKRDITDTFIRPIIYEAELGMTRESSVCGHQQSLSTDSGGEGVIVTYSDIYLEKNNFTNGHLLDDGLFIAPVAGIYQVDWKVGAANLASGEGQHFIKVAKNSNPVKESLTEMKVPNTAASIPMSGSLLVEAARGDWIMLLHQTTNNPGTLEHVSFCVHLIQEAV